MEDGDRLTGTIVRVEGGKLILKSEAALVSPLGSGWALRLANIWDRDSDHQPGFDKHDFTTILALQYSF